jgi:hypothetical protein
MYCAIAPGLPSASSVAAVINCADGMCAALACTLKSHWIEGAQRFLRDDEVDKRKHDDDNVSSLIIAQSPPIPVSSSLDLAEARIPRSRGVHR